MQIYSQLGISNDFMFGKIMQDENRCRAFLEQILNIKIDHVDILDRQKTMDEKIDAKGIRLDIYVDDGKTVYDCEMQTTTNLNLPKRSRYYQGQIDINLLKAGGDYRELKKSFVIFICTFDPFAEGRYIYTFENLCLEDPGLHLQDDAVKVFVNTKGTVGDVTEQFRELMHFLDTSEIKVYSNELVNDLAKALEDARENKEWGHDYMSLEMLLNETRAEARAEGALKKAQEAALNMLQKGVSIDLISEYLNLSVDEIKPLLALL